MEWKKRKAREPARHRFSMTERNGDAPNGSRLERLERLLESYMRESNERMTRIELSLESSARTLDRLIELRDEDWREIREREKRMDERVEKLVSGIGDLIRRLPAPKAE